eukprot:CAMPEP_0115138618 /NCGR_PEP_ID=MMETSP0227-20121206/57778_1 /TAXON_ID=89957 /ORGANISM="Polarella glacialis, Strain CCMP 1383" /LENGTH=564 /DNA_ID=CAMNT_0002546281 /DNA_START=15 /DNA_END=1705 /DNA_ORIENTATION=+
MTLEIASLQINASDPEECRILVSKFLDDWHYIFVHSHLASQWDGRRTLSTAVELLELQGVGMPGGGREALLKLSEQDLIRHVADHMPAFALNSFESTALELKTVLQDITRIRTALDAGDADGVLKSFEAPEVQNNPMTINRVLRLAVEHASQKASQIRKTHLSWRSDSEARIARLTHATADAESAKRDLLEVQARLSNFRVVQSSKAVAALAALASACDAATKSSIWAAWAGHARHRKVESQLQHKFEARIEELMALTLNHKGTRLANARSAMQRSARLCDAALMNGSFSAWSQVMMASKRCGNEKKGLDQAHAQLAEAKVGQVAKAKKVLARMIQDSQWGPLVVCWQAWLQFCLEYNCEKEADEAIDALKQGAKAAAAEKLSRVKGVLHRMCTAYDQGQLSETLQGWSQLVQEEKQLQMVNAAMRKSGARLTRLRHKHVTCARGVSGRIAHQMDLIYLGECMSAWVLHTKVDALTRLYARKLEFKREQLKGVQVLFHQFASQLEQGIGSGGDDDLFSARSNAARGKLHAIPMGRGLDAGCLPRGQQQGATLLPEIHPSKQKRP